jgi:hypothetical protein
MNKRAVILSFLVGLVLGAGTLAFGVSTLAPRPGPPQAPTVGGQPVPSSAFAIDFTKRYDLHCSGYSSTPTIIRNCKILGFTGPGEQTRPSVSLPFVSTAGQYFTAWLVLELEDGRLAYLSPHCIQFVEETPKGK